MKISTSNRSMLRGAATLGFGSTLAQGLGLIFTPVLTRLYSASDFGVFAIFFAVSQMFSQVFSARYEQSIVLAKNNRQLVVAIFISLFFTFIISFIILIFLVSIRSLLDSRANLSLDWYWPLMALIGMLGALANTFTMLSIRDGRHANVTFSRIAKVICCLGFQIGAGVFCAAGLWGLVVGEAISVLAALLVLMIGLPRGKIREISTYSFSKNSRKVSIKFARQHKDLPLVNLPHILINYGSGLFITFFIVSFFTTSEAGQYFMMQRVVMIPAGIIGMAVSQSFYATAAERNRSGARFDDLLLSVICWQTMIGVCIAVTLYFLGTALFTSVLGAEWAAAGKLSGVFAPYVAVHLVLSTLAPTPMIVGRIRTTFWLSLMQNLLFVVAFCFGAYQGGNLQDGVRAATYFSLPLMAGIVWWYLRISKHDPRT